VAAEAALRALHEHAEAAGDPRAVSVLAPARFLALLDGRFRGMERVPLADGREADPEPWRQREVAILLDGSWRSALGAFRAGVPVRAGFADGGRAPLLTHPYWPARERGGVPLGLGRRGRPPRRLPRPFRASCAELVGSLGVALREPRPRLLVQERARSEVEARLESCGLAPGEPFVLANAGSRPGSAKGFPPDRFAAALDALARLSALPVVLACAPGEEASARETAARCRDAQVFLVDDPPAGLAALAALSSLARVAIGPDNGARHLAEALGTACLVLVGPTDPRHCGESPATTRILRFEVPCGPCHREICRLRGEDANACMRRIDPERIAEAAAELLR